MDGHNLDAVFYCKEAPDIALREGMFHVCHSIGGFKVELVLSPHNFFVALHKAKIVAASFNAGLRNVSGIAGEDVDE